MSRGWRSCTLWKDATRRLFSLKGNKTLVSSVTIAFQSNFITQVTWTRQCLSLDPQSLLNNEGFTQGISSFLFSSAGLWLQHSWHKACSASYMLSSAWYQTLSWAPPAALRQVPLHVLGLLRAPSGLSGTVIGRSGLALAWRIPFLTPHWFTLVARHIEWWESLSHRKWQTLQFRNLPHPITRADLPVPTNRSGTTPSTARKQGSKVKDTVDRAQLSNLDLEVSFCAALDLMQ